MTHRSATPPKYILPPETSSPGTSASLIFSLGSKLIFHKRMGAVVTSEDDIEYQLTLTKENYEEKKDKIIKLLNI